MRLPLEEEGRDLSAGSGMGLPYLKGAYLRAHMSKVLIL